MKIKHFAGTLKLSWFLVKQDKWRYLIWTLSIVFFDYAVAGAINTMYPTAQDRAEFAIIMDNPAMVAMFGKAYGLADYTFGAMWAHMMYVWMGLIVALMGIFLVSRHLRAEEEVGRYEMVRSMPIGRNAYLGATYVVLFGLFTVFGMIKGFTLYLINIESITLVGSLNYGFGLALISWFFVTLGGVLAQLYTSNRTVMGMTFFFYLLFYILFAIGQVGDNFIAWLSPFHIMVYSQAFVNNLVWPLLLLLLISILLVAFSLYLSTKRDLGAGYFKQRQGRSNMSRFVNRPFGFALKLFKTPLIAWSFGLFILGATYGSIFGDMEQYIQDNELISQLMQDIPGVPLATQFMGVIMMVIAIVGTIPGLMALMRLGGEEGKQRMEIIMSHGVSRTEMVLSYLGVAVIAGFLGIFLGGYGLYTAAASVMDDPIPFATVFAASMVYLPSLFVFFGVLLFLIGYLPTKTWIVWVYLGLGFAIIYFGQLLDFPEWISYLTPHGYVPQLPVDDMNWLTQGLLLVVAGVLGYLGYRKYLKRDLLG